MTDTDQLPELLSKLGATTIPDAITMVDHLRERATEAGPLRKKTDALAAELEQMKRAETLRRAVASGELTPAMAWAKDRDGMPITGQPSPLFADRSPEAIEALLPQVASPIHTPSTPTTAAEAGLTDRQRRLADEAGIDPTNFKEARSRLRVTR